MKEALKYLQAGAIVPVDMETTVSLVNALKEALAQPEQEPVAWISHNAGLYHFKPDESLDPLPLYLTPPQRTWVGLTDEEIKAFDTWHDNREEEVGWVNPSEIVAYIEAKLKEKNNG